MPVQTPEELDRPFSQAFHAGNLEALDALSGPFLEQAVGRHCTSSAASR
jgi:hypothetical protein